MREINNRRLFFEIPRTFKAAETISELVGAVPDTWEGANGCLNAPENRLESLLIVRGTGLRVTGLRPNEQEVIGAWNVEETARMAPDTQLLNVPGSLPHFLLLRADEGVEKCVPINIAKRLIAYYVRLGYDGRFDFFSTPMQAGYYQRPSFVSFHLKHAGDNLGYPFRVENNYALDLSYRLVLGWESRYGGKEEDVVPILEKCRSLRLKQYRYRKETASFYIV